MKNIFKKIIAVATFIIATQTTFAQNNVGIGTNSPNASAVLDMTATDKGMLIPRMTASQRGAIASPAEGLMVYQTDAPKGFYYYNGSAWTTFGGNPVKLDLVVRKTASTQALVGSTSATPDTVVYDDVVTATSIGTYSTTTNTYTAGSAGLYLIQTRNSMVDNATAANTLGAWNYLEVAGSAYGSMTNIYPTYVTNPSSRQVTNALIKSSTQYMFMVYLNANDTVKIKATSGNTSVFQTLNNDGGTQLMIVKLN